MQGLADGYFVPILRDILSPADINWTHIYQMFEAAEKIKKKKSRLKIHEQRNTVC
jgi:hypothetical protein